jgi:hypothetical protein
MPQKRPYLSWFDSSLDIPVQQQGDDPAGLQFVPIAATNKRTITGGDSNPYVVSDLGVNARGSKSVIWSSEGYTYNGVTVAALTANQKKATGSHVANAGGTLGTVAGSLDLSPYRAVSLFVVLTSFTGGTTPNFQPELDFIDDAGTPNVIAVFKPSAVTAATSWITNAGLGLSTATITGFTVTNVGTPVLPNGQIQWTITGAPTAVAWTGILYGIN